MKLAVGDPALPIPFHRANCPLGQFARDSFCTKIGATHIPTWVQSRACGRSWLCGSLVPSMEKTRRNSRGTGESGIVYQFPQPNYIATDIGCVFLILWGIWKVLRQQVTREHASLIS